MRLNGIRHNQSEKYYIETNQLFHKLNEHFDILLDTGTHLYTDNLGLHLI